MNIALALFILTIGRFDLGFTYGVPTGEFSNIVKSGFQVNACYSREVWQGIHLGLNGTAYNFEGLGSGKYRVSYESLGLTLGFYPFALLGYDGLFINTSYNIGEFSRIMGSGKETDVTGSLISHAALKLISAERYRLNFLLNYGLLMGEEKNITVYGLGLSFTIGNEEE